MANRIDSSLLCAIFKRIGEKKYLDKLCIVEKNQRNRFTNGYRGQCYWPSHDTWFSELRNLESDKSTHFDPKQVFPLEGIELKRAIDALKISERDLPSYECQLTLASKIYNYMMELYEDEFGADEKNALSVILKVCKEHGLPEEMLAYLANLQEYSKVVHFLIKQAKNANGKPMTISADFAPIQVPEQKTTSPERWKKTVTYRQLSHHDLLSIEQLKAIALLIWETDPYIFPACLTLEQTLELLPLLFAGNKDRMFSLDNIFAGFAGDNVVAILLHKKGPLNWSSDYLAKLAGAWNVNLPETLQKTEREYFSKYNQTHPDTISILNLCIAREWREIDETYGGLILDEVLKNFLKDHDETCELYVLKETDNQIMSYLRTGFEIENACNGYSSDNRELPCFFMRLKK